jgi:hypothetical protein
MEPKIRLSTAYPINELFSFLNSATLSISNLDWISSRERLDAPFCYVLEDEGLIKALISCQPEDANAAWLRFLPVNRMESTPIIFGCFSIAR